MPSRDWALEQRLRSTARLRIEQLSGSWFAILQSAVAAGIAWDVVAGGEELDTSKR